MQFPILCRIHVAHQPGVGFHADCAELRKQVPHAQVALAQGKLDLEQRISMVHRTEGFQSTAAALGGDAAERQVGEVDQAPQERRFDVRQIAGYQHDPLGGRAMQGGVEAGHGSAGGNEVGDDGNAQMAVAGGIAQQSYRCGGVSDFEGNCLDEGVAFRVGEQGLIAPHAAALSASQDEARNCTTFGHARIIASLGTAPLVQVLRLSVYWMRNRATGNCLKQIGILLMMLVSANSFAQTRRTATTVAADSRTGRLVRTTVVVAPKVVEPKVVEPVEVGGTAPAGPEQSINELVEESARNHGVDPLLVHSVIKAESNYNPNAVSNKGAQGLMQLMPATARDLGVKNPMNPKENIEGGVKFLKYLQTQFNDPALALAAYNAGEGAVRRYNWIPPYPETQDYVVKVARNYRQAKAAASLKAAAPPPQAKVTAVVAGPVKQEAPAEPPPAPLQYFYDAQGRLTLRTVQ